MKKIIIVLAIASAALCSCAKGAKCQCNMESTVAGSTTTTDSAIIIANDDETCAQAADRLSGKGTLINASVKYSNCKAIDEK